MKKLLTLLLFVIGTTVHAQQNVGGFLQLNLGPSFSGGDFAASSLFNSNSGYATNGFQLTAVLGHKIHKRFGGFAMMTSSAYGVNRAAMTATMNQLRSDYTWTTDANFWTLFGFMFGPQYSHNFKKAAFDIRLNFGALNFNSPDLKFAGVSTIGGSDISIDRPAAKASSLVYGGGISFKYEIKWSWVLLVNADFLQATPEFKDVEQTTKIAGQDDVVDKISFKQTYRVWNTGIGVGYVF